MDTFTLTSVLLFAIVIWAQAHASSLKRLLHILQLEDYEPRRMMTFIKNQPNFLSANIFETVAVILAVITSSLWLLSGIIWGENQQSGAWSKTVVTGIGTILWFISWVIGSILRFMRSRAQLAQLKKPLVMTARAKRIYYSAFCISIIIIITLISIDYFFFERPAREAVTSMELFNLYQTPELTFALLIPTFLVVMYLVGRLSSRWMALAVIILKPVESSIQRSFLNDARRILKEHNPLVIGITGSYGKTGTKEILATILAEKYNVFKPPGSYNTLMGVTRIVREQLRPFHEIFVAEMGAYRIGSIKKLCDLTSPKHGIITTIGLQHLERFKTQRNIQTAKGELIEALPADGIAVLNGDDPLCREIGDKFRGKIVYFYVENTEKSNSLPREKAASPSPNLSTSAQTVIATNICITPTGSDFSLTFPSGESLDIHLPLIGRPAIANTAAAAAMADQLGVPHRRIKRALAAMPQVQHRLESKQGQGGITIIDDAFNSNPIGAASALEVLGKAMDGRRVLVTPGMVELGEIEEDENYKFGKLAAQSCDLAVLVGAGRIEPIRKGLLDGGFNQENLWIVPTLNEGLDKLRTYLKPGDTMLLENDLPDQYDSM